MMYTVKTLEIIPWHTDVFFASFLPFGVFVQGYISTYQSNVLDDWDAKNVPKRVLNRATYSKAANSKTIFLALRLCYVPQLNC